MSTKLKYLVPAVLAIAVGLIGADTKPAMVVQVVQTDQPEAYAEALAKINARIKEVAGIEKLRHVWLGDFAGEGSHGVFVVSSYDSAAAEATIGAKLDADPQLKQMVAALKSIRTLGSSYLYKALRSDGIYAGGAVFNTSVNVMDEDAYIKAIDNLKGIFDAAGFKDAKLNLYRVSAGRHDATHLVVISLPSDVRVGALIDAITDTPMMKDWNAAAAKIRTTVRNGTYHEITK